MLSQGHATAYANDYVLMAETAEMHGSRSVQRFVEQEVVRPSKQWIANIIDGKQETDEVIHRTDDYVLLPDTERVNRYWRAGSPTSSAAVRACSSARQFPRRMLNWLAIALDKRIRACG